MALAAALAVSGCDSVEERIEKHYARGMELLEQDQPDKAVLEFRNAVKLNENHAPSRFEIARLYEADGEMRAALGNYQLVAELDPTHLESRIKLAQIYLASGASEEAMLAAEQAAAIDPTNVDALAVRAAALFRLGQKDAAVEAAARAIELDPGHVGANIILITDLQERGRADEALARIDALLETTPDEVALNLLKLRLLEIGGDTEALGDHLERMTQVFPENVSFKQALAQLRLRANDAAGAERLLREIADAPGAEPAAALNVVRLLIAAKGRDAGRAELEARAAAAEGAAALPFVTALAEMNQADGRADEARAVLEAFIAASSESPATADDARVTLGRLLLAGGRNDEARALVEEVLTRDAAHVQALAVRSAMLVDEGRTDLAIADLRTAQNAEPQNHSLLILEARAHERAGSADLAGDRLASAARLSNFAPDVALLYAQHLRNRDQVAAAETILAESARRNPGSPQVLAALADTRIRLGDWAGAEEIGAALARLEDGQSLADRVRAASLSAQGRVEESAQLLRNLAEADPSLADDVLTTLVLNYMRAGQGDEAKRVIDEALAQNPRDPRALLLRAEMSAVQGDLVGAKASVAEVLAIDPDGEAGNLAMIRLHIVSGELDEAESRARAAIDRVPDPTRIRLQLAGLLERAGDFDGAIAQYEALYERNPSSIMIANNLASMLADHRADDAAALERAALIAQRLRGSTQPELQDTFGWIQHLRGESELALRSLIPAADALPQNAIVQFHAGMALASIGQTGPARERLEAALAIDPAFPRAAEARAALEGLPAATP
jgi:tetratricopeptide (TPR) repeat protein